MAISLSTSERKVYDYLQRIEPEWVSNTNIMQATRISSHQQVFLITRNLFQRGLIRGEQGRLGKKEWAYSALPIQTQAVAIEQSSLQPTLFPEELAEGKAADPVAVFERLAEEVMSRHFGESLRKSALPGVPKIFDLVSTDEKIAGDAKYYPLVGGKPLPPSKFATIAENVWLLEKTQASHRFLVFGNRRDIPIQWLKKYNHLVSNVEFFFLTSEGVLEKING